MLRESAEMSEYSQAVRSALQHHGDVFGFLSSVGAEVNHCRQRVHVGAVADVAKDALLDDDEGHAGNQAPNPNS